MPEKFPMLKVLILLAPFVALSGCCRVFGICADVSVRTSIDHSEKFTDQQNYHPLGSAALETTRHNNAGSCSIAMR